HPVLEGAGEMRHRGAAAHPEARRLDRGLPLPGGRRRDLSAPVPPVTSVYRTRSYVQRRRALLGLAGVVLLLTGYGIGRWQDTPAPVVPVAAPPAAASEI